MKKFLIKLIDLYQKYISPFKKGSCVFYPTCSEYTKSAIDKYGPLKGSYLGFRRILRCHPWQKNHMDKLP
ncbi:MAG TPA: membrane protein insertion efficiency factor YidD [Candidatus Paceibacterota bacterium]